VWRESERERERGGGGVYGGCCGCIQNINKGRQREHRGELTVTHARGGGSTKDPTGQINNTHDGNKCTRTSSGHAGRLGSGRGIPEKEEGDGGRVERERERKKGAPYLHGLDGLEGVLHRAELLVLGLVRQQQLVEDLQRPGPVADRFQRHDREKTRRGRWEK